MDNLTGLIFPATTEDLRNFILANKIKRIKFNKYMLDDEEWIKKYTYNLCIFLKFENVLYLYDKEYLTLISEIIKTNNIKSIEITLSIRTKILPEFTQEILDLDFVDEFGKTKIMYYYLCRILKLSAEGKNKLLNHTQLTELFQKHTPFLPEDDYISALKKYNEEQMLNFNLYQVRIKIPKYILLKLFDKYLN
jgi:hypothetical protein